MISPTAASGAPSVVVVGAGISGLAAAHTLTRRGHAVTVVERSHDVGGRLATRLVESAGFDHGAQYFTARDPVFRRHVATWIDEGVAAEWDGRIVHLDDGGAHRAVDGGPRYVGVPGMRAVARYLASDVAVSHGVEVRRVVRDGGGWRIESVGGPVDGRFDALVIAVAPEQALRILDAADPLRPRVAGCPSLPCWATLVSFDAPVAVGFDGAFLDDACVAWAARDSSKPGREDGERWVLHATPRWSAARTQADPGSVARPMLEAFAGYAGIALPRVDFVAAHRWRFARVAEGAGAPCLFDAERGVAICGDWCPGSRVEGAFVSGVAAAERVVEALRRG